MKIVELESVSKKFKTGNTVTTAVDDVSFSLNKGESLAIMGTSGSGKSTLLNLIGGLDKVTSGQVKVNGVDITKMSDSKISEFRNKTIGFVFQFFNLLDYLTATENVAIQIMLAGVGKKVALEKSQELLKKVGLAHRLDSYPKQLSGGEMQRVAIARSLANNPSLLLADEPTANLDKTNSEKILDLFAEIAKSGLSIIVITHDPKVSGRYERVFNMSQGRLVK